MADRRLAWAVVAVIVRYLTIVQPQARRQLARWRRRTHAIENVRLRQHVVHPYDVDRSAEGAAIFAVLRPSSDGLVSLLIAYVLLWSYVDVVTERDPDHDPRLFRSLVDALTPGTRMPHYGEPDDGGYLRDLVRVCQHGCAHLPAWDIVRPLAIGLAEQGSTAQALNHDPSAIRLPLTTEQLAPSYHLTRAAASSPLAIHALLALAANPRTTSADARATIAAYFPPISALAVLADHLTDAVEDATLNNHSYLRYFGSSQTLADELSKLAGDAALAARGLPQGERHLVILAAMACMFFVDEDLSHGSTGRRLLDAVGPATAPLLFVLRCRRRVEMMRPPTMPSARWARRQT
jgi:tetraprenyl-beta-curcumene synthase